jgi:hypothetical protein
MNPAEYLPLYGFIKTPRNSKIYIGTRKLYLDVNPELYNFMINIVKQINNGEKINIDEKWKEELKNHQEFFVGKKPIFKVFLKKVGVNKQKIFYQVNWNLLLKNLEIKSQNIIDRLKRNPNIGLGILYDELASNYMMLKGLGNLYPKELSKQKLGLRETEDFIEMEYYLEKFYYIVNNLEKRFPSDSFFDLYWRLNQYVYNLDLNGLYYTLRETLERLFPILFVKVIQKKSKLNDRALISFYFLYLNYTLKAYWKEKGSRPKSLYISKKKDLNETIKQFLDNVEKYKLLKEDYTPDFDKWELAFTDNNFSLPLITIDARSFLVLTNELGIKSTYRNGDLKRLYEVCSSSIHNNLSFPVRFFLEIKVAKHFLAWYMKEVEWVLSQLHIIEPNQTPNKVSTIQKSKISLKNLVNFYESNESKISEIIKEEVSKNSRIFEFELLKSLYIVYQPGVSKLKNGKTNFYDFKEFVFEIQQISYNLGIQFVYDILDKLGNEIKHKLNSRELDKFQSSEIGFVTTYMYFEYSQNRGTN